MVRPCVTAGIVGNGVSSSSMKSRSAGRRASTPRRDAGLSDNPAPCSRNGARPRRPRLCASAMILIISVMPPTLQHARLQDIDRALREKPAEIFER